MFIGVSVNYKRGVCFLDVLRNIQNVNDSSEIYLSDCSPLHMCLYNDV